MPSSARNLYVARSRAGEDLAPASLYARLRKKERSLLVLLDLNMPVMDGLEFLEHQLYLPQVCQQVTAVVVVSATPDPAERARAQALAVEVRPKPLAATDVADLVRRYLPAAWPA